MSTTWRDPKNWLWHDGAYFAGLPSSLQWNPATGNPGNYPGDTTGRTTDSVVIGNANPCTLTGNLMENLDGLSISGDPNASLTISSGATVGGHDGLDFTQGTLNLAGGTLTLAYGHTHSWSGGAITGNNGHPGTLDMEGAQPSGGWYDSVIEISTPNNYSGDFSAWTLNGQPGTVLPHRFSGVYYQVA